MILCQYSKLEKKILDFAQEKILSKCNPDNKSLHCSVLCAGSVIISFGVNKENHLLGIKYRKRAIHSEYECLRRFFRTNIEDSIDKLDMYNVRITRLGQIKMARPCEKCTKLLSNTFNRPRRIYFTSDTGEFIKM